MAGIPGEFQGSPLPKKQSTQSPQKSGEHSEHQSVQNWGRKLEKFEDFSLCNFSDLISVHNLFSHSVLMFHLAFCSFFELEYIHIVCTSIYLTINLSINLLDAAELSRCPGLALIRIARASKLLLFVTCFIRRFCFLQGV